MTYVDLAITNAKIVTSRYIVEAGIAIDEQRIATIAKEPHLPKADRSIDAQGMLVMPGLIDAHVHLRDPGYTQKEDFLTGTKAAANGGVTLVMDEPNTNPATASLEAFKEKRDLGEAKAVTDFALSVGLNHENIAEIPRFSEAGAISYSIFTTASGDLGVVDDYVAFEALKAVESVNGTAAVSPMLGDMSSRVMSELMESQRRDLKAHIESSPRVATVGSVAEMSILAKYADTRVHFRESSTSDTIDLLEVLKRHVYDKITTEIGPQYLLLTLEDYERLGPYGRVYPPIASKGDTERCWKALNDGVIDIIATDHAPHTAEEKEAGKDDIWRSPAGFPSLETTLPLMMTQVKKGRISIHRLVEASSELPAKIFNVYPKKGAIHVGSDADLVVVDPKQRALIKTENLYSRAGWTPYEGWEVFGVPTTTLVRGEIVMQDGEIYAKPGFGRLVQPCQEEG